MIMAGGRDARDGAVGTLPQAARRDFSAVGYDEAMRRARELVPLLRERAAEAEDARMLIRANEQLLHESYVMGTTLIDPLWVAGLLAIGAGGVLAAGRPEPTILADEMSRRGGILPAVTFALLVTALVHLVVEEAPLGPQLMLAAGALVSGGTMIVRTVLLERRLGSLLRYVLDRRMGG